MNRPLRVHPRADLDVIETFTFLARRSPDAARRFLDAVEKTLLAIESRPDDGHRYVREGREGEELSSASGL